MSARVHARQGSFFKSNKFQYQHGGELRRKRAGRGKRPLSTKDSLHVVFKMNREAHRPGLRNYTSYALSMRVVAGQIAQGLGRRMTDTPKPPQKRTKFWKYRPFSRVVKSWTAEKTVRNYIQLNEKEARGEIPYSKDRLKGLTPEQIQELWE
jgi:putative transposase